MVWKVSLLFFALLTIRMTNRHLEKKTTGSQQNQESKPEGSLVLPVVWLTCLPGEVCGQWCLVHQTGTILEWKQDLVEVQGLWGSPGTLRRFCFMRRLWDRVAAAAVLQIHGVKQTAGPSTTMTAWHWALKCQCDVFSNLLFIIIQSHMLFYWDGWRQIKPLLWG